MIKFNLTPTVYLCIALSFFMFVLTIFEKPLFPLLTLEAAKITDGEYWRIFTANFAHFGWAHTLMNTAALLLCSLAFFSNYPVNRFSFLLFWCSLAVGFAIYLFSPEYSPYAGLSGVIHGLIVAGLLQPRAYPVWVRLLGSGLIIAKLIQENMAGYQATDLQTLIPVAVAVESHVYGAIAGLVFVSGDWLTLKLLRK